jgi:hypothetical protein
MGYRPGPDPEWQMNRDLVVLPEAEADLADAYTWYEERLPGLGSAFLLSVEAVIHSITRGKKGVKSLTFNIVLCIASLMLRSSNWVNGGASQPLRGSDWLIS